MSTLTLYLAAAVAEIAGCFAFWAVARLGAPAVWLGAGLVLLAAFAWLLARVDVDFAGRAFAAYGGVYIAASLVWLWAVEGRVPDRFDIVGAALSLAGAATIVLWPRGG